MAEDLFRDIDIDEIREAVFDALDGIDVHELWDRAGPKRDGYTSPEDLSVEMFEEALEPFVQEMQKHNGTAPELIEDEELFHGKALQ